MSKKPKKTLTPRTARTFEQICTLKRDNVSTVDYWMMVCDGGKVVICAQRDGQAVQTMLRLPRHTFEKFIDWYNTGEWPIKRKKQGAECAEARQRRPLRSASRR